VSENIKTLIYVACACLVVVIAYASRPKEESRADKYSAVLKEPLFKSFTDPDKASRLKIVKVDADTGEPQPFEVARDKKLANRWTIPSHNGYPADAEERVRDASTMFIDLKPIAIFTEFAEDHAQCGVLEPKEESSSDTKDVGTLVNIQNREGQELASLIIGKKVKGSETQSFVRIPGKDTVYVAELDPTKLSTKFEDWIEKDLLKLNAWEIADVSLFDYSVIEALPPGTYATNERMQVDLTLDATKSEWNLQKLVTYRDGEEVPAKLADDEQLNSEKLNELKTALDDLEIANVYRKPEGISADLRADQQLIANRETVKSLVEKGFIPRIYPDKTIEIKSTNGEIHVGMKDGVDYILRFGSTEQAPGGKLNRYLLVTAQFDESKFPMPERTPGAGSTPASNENPPAESGDSAPPSGAEAPPAAPGACQVEESSAPESGSSQQQPNIKPADSDAPAGQATSPAAETQEQRLEKEYQRQLTDREDKIKKGKQRARELNGRFADWYYVISEDVYKKVHLSRADIVKPKEGEAGIGLDSFRKFEEEGLQKLPPPTFQHP